METRPGRPDDMPRLLARLSSIENFSSEEIACARELVELALAATAEHADYKVLVAEAGGALAGYVCFGPTPMTDGTWDLYWIASFPEVRGKGAGSALVLAMEADIRRRGGRQVRVETSSKSEYAATRVFYERHRYLEASRLRDFYAPGDDLVTLYKSLPR
jgi:ribosomal protein S18 acetylase RimI-like enzyme